MPRAEREREILPFVSEVASFLGWLSLRLEYAEARRFPEPFFRKAALCPAIARSSGPFGGGERWGRGIFVSSRADLRSCESTPLLLRETTVSPQPKVLITSGVKGSPFSAPCLNAEAMEGFAFEQRHSHFPAHLPAPCHTPLPTIVLRPHAARNASGPGCSER